jgi:hypothetical protein
VTTPTQGFRIVATFAAKSPTPQAVHSPPTQQTDEDQPDRDRSYPLPCVPFWIAKEQSVARQGIYLITAKVEFVLA